MKLKIFTLGLLICFSCSILAQEKQSRKSSIGLTFSAINNSRFVNFEREISSISNSLSGPSYSVESSNIFGMCYIQPIYSLIDIETGIEYSNRTIEQKIIRGFMTQTEYNRKDVSYISIPVTARVNFDKYFFLNGGIIFNFEMEKPELIDSQTGIGAILGIGAKYNLSNELGVFVNGYYKLHALVPFSEKKDDQRQRLSDIGLRLGIAYNF